MHDQPFQVLAMLLARPGELVTREEIQQRLWRSGTFVDFENGLNSAVNRLRDALSETKEQPKFIETIPRRGYRFIAPVEQLHVLRTPGEGAQPEQEARKFGRRFWIFGTAAACALVVTAFGAWRLWHSPKRVLNFGSRDWVLISSFDNRTGNPLLDGSLEFALERELSNSQFVNVVPRERVGDALKLMRKPLEAKVDAALGREICLRDGGVRALLTGRIEKLGTSYVLSAQIVNPVSGVAVASLSEEDPADSQLAAAVRRLSNRVREALGERSALIQQSDRRLEKVTTPSLHALQLYSRADELMRAEQAQAEAGELLEQAVREDPNFASAHVQLGWTYVSRGKYAEAKREFRGALALADTASDREQLFIKASYYENVEKNATRSNENYEALLSLYPDDYWAANRERMYYTDRGQWNEAFNWVTRVVDLRPDDLRLTNLAACGLFANGDFDRAKPYIERSRKLAAADANGPHDSVDVEVLALVREWSQGDIAQARSDFLKLRELRGSANLGRADPFLFWSFGEFAEVEKLIQSEPDWTRKNAILGMNSYIKGDTARARSYFREMLKDANYGGFWPQVVGRTGLWKEVENNIRNASRDLPIVQIIEGEDALAHRQTQKAITLLEKGTETMHMLPTGAFYTGTEALARAYEEQGNFDAAVRVLLQAIDAKDKTYNCFSGFVNGAWWLRDELELANVYRKLGRVLEAEKVEDELRKMLIYADADHPILLELKKRDRLSAELTSKAPN